MKYWTPPVPGSSNDLEERVRWLEMKLAEVLKQLDTLNQTAGLTQQIIGGLKSGFGASS